MKGGIVSTILAIQNTNTSGIGVLFYGDEETTFKGINNITANAKKLFRTAPKLIVSPESRFNLGVGHANTNPFLAPEYRPIGVLVNGINAVSVQDLAHVVRGY